MRDSCKVVLGLWCGSVMEHLPSVSETLRSIPTLQERRWEERNSPFPYRTHSNYQKTPLLIKSEPAILELSITGCDPVLQI